MSKGKLFIVSGPSGSGKDTILQRVFEQHPEIKFSISTVTRPKRNDAKEDGKYNFITKEEFLNMLADDMLLEHNEYAGNFYGTPRKPVEECIDGGTDMIVEVDVNGAANIRSKMPDAVSIFIMPPSFNELKRRLNKRGTESEDVVKMRLEAALSEIARAHEYDYIVINDVLENAVDDLLSVILSERLKLNRQKYIIDEVLEKC